MAQNDPETPLGAYYGEWEELTEEASSLEKLESTKLFKLMKEGMLDIVYPVGAIYLSVNNTSPATLFGGTWEQITGRFLLASGDLLDENDNILASYTLGDEDGEAEHSLTESEMPRHTHIQDKHRHTQSGWWSSGSGSSSGYTYHSSRTVQNAYTTYTTPTNQYTGGTGTEQTASNGVAHNNMPPYLAVNVWKRTA